MDIAPKWRVIGLLLFFSLLRASEQTFSVSAKDRECFNKHDRECSKCIEDPHCHWCSKTKESVTEHKCFSIDTDLLAFCEKEFIESPKNDVTKEKNEPFAEKGGASDGTSAKLIQLRPQKIKLRLRKDVAINISLEYQQLENYPLDLYYLMDLSYSLKPDKLTIEKLGEKLAKQMTKLTSKFRIGFGSFVDKVMPPIINAHPELLKGLNKEIAIPFSFKNNLKLTNDSTRFTTGVKIAKISRNIDTPEGGFEALMQAMVCDEQIGWKKEVQKIIVFSTDQTFHSAGDGKIVGVTEENNEKCYLDKDEFYRAYDRFDYPSIGQINEKAKQNGFNIIFAVKGEFDVYQNLTARIEDSEFGQLDQDSTNVINLITQVYNSISSRVKIGERSESEDRPISIKYFSRCNNDTSSPMNETDTCDGVKEGQIYEFLVSLQLDECPPGVKTMNLTLGTAQSQVEIEIELLCECGCEQQNSTGRKPSSDLCSLVGTRECGVCDCNSGYYGQECECSQDDQNIQKSGDESKCRPEGKDENTAVCNGNGECSCSTCICHEFFSGSFCECERRRCKSNQLESQLCSGHGKCQCKRCECEPGWLEPFCKCRTDDECVKKGDPADLKCSGNGDCECGVCRCKVKDGVLHSGEFCEDCPSCGKGKCEEYRDCVQCDVWDSGKLKGKACRNCTVQKVPRFYSLREQRDEGATLCAFLDESTGCSFNFTYLYKDQKYIINAQNTQKCPEKFDILALTASVIAAIVAIGVLTLIIWKIVATIHDRREYSKFEDESNNANWGNDENPLYEEPSTTVSNPAFKTKK